MEDYIAVAQAANSAIEHTQDCMRWLNQNYPELDEEILLPCATKMAISASINLAITVLSSQIPSPPHCESVSARMEQKQAQPSATEESLKTTLKLLTEAISVRANAAGKSKEKIHQAL